MSDGITAVRIGTVADNEQIRRSIDDVVITAMGWTAEIVDESADSAGGVLFVVVDVESGDLTGVISASIDPVAHQALRLGMWSAPLHRGQGHMKRGMKLLVTNLPNGWLRAETPVDNAAARRVLAYAELQVEGRHLARQPNQTEAAGLIYSRAPINLVDAAVDAPVATRQPVLQRDITRPLLLLFTAMSALVIGLVSFTSTTDLSGTPCGSVVAPHQLTGTRCSEALDSNRAVIILALIVFAVTGFLNVRWTLARRTQRDRPGSSIVGPGVIAGPDLVDGATLVRNAEPNDEAGIAATIDDAVAHAMAWRIADRAAWPERVRSDLRDSILIVCHSEDVSNPIGVITVQRQPSALRGQHVNMWIDAEHRHLGHMKRAMRMLSNHFHSLDTAIFAEAREENAAARAVLRHAALTQSGQRRVVLTNGDEYNAVLYERHPRPAIGNRVD